jgi:hypothetical protein
MAAVTMVGRVVKFQATLPKSLEENTAKVM